MADQSLARPASGEERGQGLAGSGAEEGDRAVRSDKPAAGAADPAAAQSGRPARRSGLSAAQSGQAVSTAGPSSGSETSLAGTSKRWTGWEIVIVLSLGLGRSAVSSILNLVNRLTVGVPLADQTTQMNNTVTPDRPWLDLAYQVANTVFPLAHVLLALYLLHLAHGRARRLIGFDGTRLGRDLASGFIVAAAIGLPGLGFYLAARELGFNTTVAAANLTAQWWTTPALIAAALANGLVEEIVMLGYLLTRLADRGWPPWAAVALSAAIRGAYHLYQGFGGGIGNFVMGVVFACCYRRWGRVLPLVAAHTLIDIAAFVGYAALKPHVSWL